MIAFLVRSLGVLLVAGGFAAVIVDGTRTIAANGLMLVSVGDFVQALAPKQFVIAQTALQHVQPDILQIVVLRLLTVPNFLFLSILGCMCFWIARPRHRAR